jgi:hypothetical protein
MKLLIPFTAIAALAASSILSAQTPAYSKPSGYVTQELGVGFNLVGLTLQNAPVFSGEVSAVSGADVTFSTDISALLPSGKTFILEVVSGTGQSDDAVQEFVAASGNTITLPTVLVGLAVGDAVVIRLAPTLEEVFGTLLQSQSTAGGSDVIWLSAGAGQYDRYYYKTPFFGSPVWTKLGSGNTELAAPNTPVIYLDGMFVQIKSTPKSLTITGAVKTTASKFSVETGFNLVGTSFPVGSTLATSNLQSFLQSQATVGGSDIIWISEGPGAFSRYYYQTPFFGSPSWVQIDGNVETKVGDGSSIPLTSGVFVQCKGGGKVITVTPPSSYSSL